MTVVVADTSPLNYLILMEAIELLAIVWKNRHPRRGAERIDGRWGSALGK